VLARLPTWLLKALKVKMFFSYLKVLKIQARANAQA
jgi:hypothetical protein